MKAKIKIDYSTDKTSLNEYELLRNEYFDLEDKLKLVNLNLRTFSLNDTPKNFEFLKREYLRINNRINVIKSKIQL